MNAGLFSDPFSLELRQQFRRVGELILKAGNMVYLPAFPDLKSGLQERSGTAFSFLDHFH
jgi:hypothetical protein